MPVHLLHELKILEDSLLALSGTVENSLHASIKALHEHDVPALIVNGRLTRRSLKRGGPWLRRAASRLSLVLARDPASASAFRES